jgi:hypothetical protein
MVGVAAEIVDDDDVAGFERRNQDLPEIGQEAFAVDRAVDDAGRIDPVAPPCGKARSASASGRALFFRKAGREGGECESGTVAKLKPGRRSFSDVDLKRC